MSEDSITDWFACIYRQSEATIAIRDGVARVLDAVRKNGADVGDCVVVDVTDEATRFFVSQLGDAPIAPDTTGACGS